MGALLGAAYADVYLHVPRGSNNRLNDSQNNNRGGYNHSDSTAQASGNDEGKQYRMKYFMSSAASLNPQSTAGESYLTFEWTNQHGCGGNEDTDPHKQNCNLVFQYQCQDDVDAAAGANNDRA